MRAHLHRLCARRLQDRNYRVFWCTWIIYWSESFMVSNSPQVSGSGSRSWVLGLGLHKDVPQTGSSQRSAILPGLHKGFNHLGSSKRCSTLMGLNEGVPQTILTTGSSRKCSTLLGLHEGNPKPDLQKVPTFLQMGIFLIRNFRKKAS